jgi:hypothetical protein
MSQYFAGLHNSLSLGTDQSVGLHSLPPHMRTYTNKSRIQILDLSVQAYIAQEDMISCTIINLQFLITSIQSWKNLMDSRLVASS